MDMSNTRHVLERNVGNYVDFSTPPLSFGQPYDTFVIVDVSMTVEKYLHHSDLLEFYRLFPLHDVVATLLSVSLQSSMAPGHWDFLAFVTEERLGERVDLLDMDSLFLTFEAIVYDIEREITRKYPQYMHSEQYVFYRWVDTKSICLCLERYGRMFTDIGRTN